MNSPATYLLSFSTSMLRVICFAFVFLLFGGYVFGENAVETAGAGKVLPRPVTSANFSALRENSPFVRSVGLSKSIVLTGIADIEGETVATLIDMETKESYVVSREANVDGWQLIEVTGDHQDLETVTTQIKIAGGEVVAIRFEKIAVKTTRPGGSGGRSGSSAGGGKLSYEQLKEAKSAAIKFGGEFSADGYPKVAPPEVVKKLSRMSVQQRETLNREMLELRNRGASGEERRKIYENKIDSAIRGR